LLFVTVILSVGLFAQDCRNNFPAEFRGVIGSSLCTINDDDVPGGEIDQEILDGLIAERRKTKNQDVKIAFEAKFDLFPNPSFNILTYTSDQSGLLEIYDIRGVKVKEVRIVDTGQIDISMLNPGLLHIKFTSEEGVISSRKIIVAK